MSEDDVVTAVSGVLFAYGAVLLVITMLRHVFQPRTYTWPGQAVGFAAGFTAVAISLVMMGWL